MSNLENSKKAQWRILKFFTPLQYRNFVLLWGGQNISRLGNSIYETALGWTVFAVTGSVTSMGLVLAAFSLPQVLFLLIGGVFGDRYNRQTILMCADLASGTAMALVAFLIFSGQATVTYFILLSICLGISSAFYGPALGQMIRDTVPEEEIQPANALDNVTFNSVLVAGPALGGVLYATLGAAGTFAINAVTFLVAAVATMFMKNMPQRVATMKSTVGREIKEAFTYTLQNRWLLYTIGLSIVINVFAIAPYFVLLPAVVHAHGLPVSALGIATAAQGIAGVGIGILLSRSGKFKSRGQMMFWLASALGGANVLLGFSDHLIEVVSASVVLGLGMGVGILENSLLQQYVAPEYLSRVYSLNMIGSFALLPLGYAISGMLADQVGVRTVLISGGIIAMVFSLAVARSKTMKQLI